MNPILFQIDGNSNGGYLLGQYAWPFAVVLTRAACEVRDLPATGTLTLTLEIGGGATAVQFVVTAAGVTPATQNLSVSVPANTFVRWHAVFDDVYENSADGVVVVMYPALPSLSTAPALTVRYVNGAASYSVLTYANGLFAEVTPGILAANGLTFYQGAYVSFGIAGYEVLRVDGNGFQVRDFYASGVATTDSPRLQFEVNGVPIAALSAAALRVVNVWETAPPLPDAGTFGFYTGSTLVATLAAVGLTGTPLKQF